MTELASLEGVEAGGMVAFEGVLLRLESNGGLEPMPVGSERVSISLLHLCT